MNLKMSLQQLGYNIVSTADNSLHARNKIRVYEPNILLINISLQKSNDGIELAQYIREKHELPFIYLTAHSDNNIIDQAKPTQPYGYIIKPFEPEGLNAAIQIALYRYEQEQKRNQELNGLKKDKLNLEKLLYDRQVTDKPIIPFGDSYHLDIRICETFYSGHKIKLTKKENAFIRLLVAQIGHVVSFDQAIDYVWEEEGATENSVRTLVWRLRNKLPTDIIKNSSGIGYYIED